MMRHVKNFFKVAAFASISTPILMSPFVAMCWVDGTLEFAFRILMGTAAFAFVFMWIIGCQLFTGK